MRVEPHGKFGKYGKAYGFYYRNGERADAFEDNPEQSWCKKDDTEPQEIPCCGCGSWWLLDILGEPSAEVPKMLGLDDCIGFGKYKDKTIREVVDSDWQYIKWAIIDSQRLYADVEAVVKYHESHQKVMTGDDVLTFGKYKGQKLSEVYSTDPQYLTWLSQNNDSFKIDFDNLNAKKE